LYRHIKVESLENNISLRESNYFCFTPLLEYFASDVVHCVIRQQLMYVEVDRTNGLIKKTGVNDTT